MIDVTSKFQPLREQSIIQRKTVTHMSDKIFSVYWCLHREKHLLAFSFLRIEQIFIVENIETSSVVFFFFRVLVPRVESENVFLHNFFVIRSHSHSKLNYFIMNGHCSFLIFSILHFLLIFEAFSEFVGVEFFLKKQVRYYDNVYGILKVFLVQFPLIWFCK